MTWLLFNIVLCGEYKWDLCPWFQEAIFCLCSKTFFLLTIACKLSNEFHCFKLRLAKNLWQVIQLTWQMLNYALLSVYNGFCHMLRFAVQCSFLIFFHCLEICAFRDRVDAVFNVIMQINTKHFSLVCKCSCDSQCGFILSMCLLPFLLCTSSDLIGFHH